CGERCDRSLGAREVIQLRSRREDRRANRQKTKGLRGIPLRPFLRLTRQRPTLPQSSPCSTIGSDELNFRVRDGIGCGLVDIATGNFWASKQRVSRASDSFW